MSAEVYVKLRDRGIIFHDASQDQSITGTAVVKFKKTAKVQSAIRAGLLIEQTGYKEPKAKDDTAKSDAPKPYTKWKKDELTAELTKREIEFDPEATNAVLAEALFAHDDANKEQE